MEEKKWWVLNLQFETELSSSDGSSMDYSHAYMQPPAMFTWSPRLVRVWLPVTPLQAHVL